MWFRSVEIENFRAIGHLKLDLHRHMNVLVGVNASGKTSVLDAIVRAFDLEFTKWMNLVWPELTWTPLPEFQLRDVRRAVGGQQGTVRVGLSGGDRWSVRATWDGRDQPVSVPTAVWDRPVSVEDEIPALIQYDTGRGRLEVEGRTTGDVVMDELRGRLRGLVAAHSSSHRFDLLVEWFEQQSTAEALEIVKRRDFNFQLPGLTAVRQAVLSMIPGCKRIWMEGAPARLRVLMEPEGEAAEEFDFEELSDGYRLMLGLVADMARRLITVNPHQGLNSEGVVLIDEVDLHLHPRWQQQVLPGLVRTFPNIQFIVTTHAAPVIATVPPESLICLIRDADGIHAERPESSEGALPERILKDIMGLEDARPPEISAKLRRYWDLVLAGQGEGEEGLELRRWLEERFRGEEPDLARLDLELRRRRPRP